MQNLLSLLQQGGMRQSGPPAPPPPLVEFKAGKCHYDTVRGGPTLRIVPDKRRGLIRVTKGADGLTKFQWLPRQASEPEDDVIVLPGSATWVRTPTGNDEDRVWRIELSGGQRMFFWMQEPKEEQDEKNQRAMDRALAGDAQSGTSTSNNRAGAGAPQGSQLTAESLAAALQQSTESQPAGSPAPATPAAATAADDGRPAGMSDEDWEVHQAIMMSLTDSGADAAPAAADGGDASEQDAGTGRGGERPAGMTDEEWEVHQAIMMSLAGGDEDGTADAGQDGAAGNGGQQPDGSGSHSADAAASPGGNPHMTQEALAGAIAQAMQAMQASAGARATDLRRVLTSANTGELLEDPAVVQRLLPLLPEEQRTEQALRDTLSSPQFQQSVAQLSHALADDNVNAVFANFGLDPAHGADALARGDGAAALADALTAAAQSRRAAEEGGEAQGAAGSAAPSDSEGARPS